MKRVLFVIPPSPGKKKIIRLIDCSHEAKANYLWQPNDFMIISSLLEKDDTASLVDGTCDRLSEEEFLRQLQGIKPDILFFALSSVCWASDLEYFRKTVKLFTDVPSFVIGDIFLEAHYREIILKECDGIVFAPYLLDLNAMAIFRQDEKALSFPGVCTDPHKIVFTGEKQLRRVKSGVTRHDIFLKSGYRFPFSRHLRFATVTTMWGCPFSCSYCTDSKIPPMLRSAEDVLAEMEYIDNLKVKELFVADKTFGLYHKESFPILKEMARRFAFSWSCYFHPQTYNAELLDLMKSAGCHTIIIGIDSADMLSLKQYNRNVSLQKLEALLLHAQRLQMNICADFILGLEHESEENIINTLNYALRLPIDFASFNIAAPLPGSDIRERALKEGNLTLGQEGFDTLGASGVLGNKNIDCQKIMRLRKNAVRKFYMRPSYLFKRIRQTASLEHMYIQLVEMLCLFKKQI